MPFSAREEGCHVRLCFAMVCFALCGCASHMHASLEWVVVHEAVQSPSGFNNPLRTFTKVLSYPCLFTMAQASTLFLRQGLCTYCFLSLECPQLIPFPSSSLQYYLLSEAFMTWVKDFNRFKNNLVIYLTNNKYM